MYRASFLHQLSSLLSVSKLFRNLTAPTIPQGPSAKSHVIDGKNYLSHFLLNVSFTYALSICTWFLKNQVGKIQFYELDNWCSNSSLVSLYFMSSNDSRWVLWTGSLVYFELDFYCLCSLKNQFRNWFLQYKNPVCRIWFLQLDFYNMIFQKYRFQYKVY